MSEGKETELDTGNDRELFNEAMGPETVEKPASDPPQETADKAGKERDPETGRFVPKPAEAQTGQKPVEQKQEQAPANTQQQEQEPADRIPAWRLREEAEAKREALARAETAQRQYEETQRQLRELQRQFQANQKPVEVPDVLQDPSAYAQHLQAQFEKARQEDRLNMSLNLAARFHGKEKFNKAFEEFEQNVQRGDRALYQRVMASTDPGEAIVQWHQEQATLKEIGNDPQAFRKKAFTEGLTQKENEAVLVEAIKNNPELLGKLIAEAQGQAAANAKGPNKNSVTRLPSLNRQTSAAPNDIDGGDMTDKELLAAALAR